jgi:hypothetical protein
MSIFSMTGASRIAAMVLTRQEAAGRKRQLMAGLVGNVRQLTGIIDSDDRFAAASSAGWLSSLDPQPTNRALGSGR